MGIGGVGLFAAVVIFGGYYLEWEWTGFPKRTPWDWVDLLIVPIVLALGGYLFTRSENQRTQRIAERQRDVDREIAQQRSQDDTLQVYLDQIGQLLLDKDRPLRESEEGAEVRTLARARTLTVLGRLDRAHKRSALQFLYESGLITGPNIVLDLTGADLSGAALQDFVLNGADLSKVILHNADLRGAGLFGTDLSEAKLSGADLTGAFLRGTNLYRADLREANLRGAYLVIATLRNADLRHVELGGATLRNTNLDGANLSGASLAGAYLGEANLSDANLSGANLSGADLIGVPIPNPTVPKDANLSGAVLSGANLTDR
jgi:uncharacterized protein YjbI with pentapeptide repeats